MPRIRIGLLSFPNAPEYIEEEDECREAEDECTNRHERVHPDKAREMRILRIIIDAAHHSANT